MTSHRNPPRRPRGRRGSALVLVLIMTLSLAGLAISAIYLSSSAGLLTRYYDRERDYRFAAEAALALGKSRVNRDASLNLPQDTAMSILSGASLTDAAGVAIPKIKVNLYGAYTGDTVGRFGQFVTLVSQAFDTGGTRHVRRLDLTAESFSRYAMFTNTFDMSLCYGTGEFIRGRAHSNQSWASCGPPGPTYFDTVSANGTVVGTATYTFPSLPGSAIIQLPTIAKLAQLPVYANLANLKFTPVTGTSAAPAVVQGGVNLSGQMGGGNPVQGTRVRFKTVDINNDGAIQEEEGMMMVFNLASGMDTSTLRADLPRAGATPITNVVMLNQCGLLVRIAAPTPHNEFFPVARFRELWVRARVAGATKVVGGVAYTTADTNGLGAGTATSIANIMSFGIGNSRCFPPGSPLLMLTERYVGAGCAATTATNVTPWAWGAPGATAAGCTAAQVTAMQYGGMDSTFTAIVTRCALTGTAGGCTGNQVSLGAWVAWAGVALPAIPVSVLQAVERPYLWPLFKPYNLASKGVINSTTGPVYLSDTLRGNITFYQSDSTKDVIIIDDLVYDLDPTVSTALCRNFLGIIAGEHVLSADNGLNRPRFDALGVVRWFGFPNFTLHAVTMALKGTVGIEDGYSWPTTSPGGPATTPATVCGAVGNVTSGGCINQTGGVIEQYISVTYTGASDGMRENRTVDPCQKTNRRPPFFPATGRYLDNKYYEIDPVNVDSWTQVKAFFAKLRGRSAP